MFKRGHVFIPGVFALLLSLPGVVWPAAGDAPVPVAADGSYQEMREELKVLTERMRALETRLSQAPPAPAAASPPAAGVTEALQAIKAKMAESPIRVGGAVRFTYRYTDFEDRFYLSERDKGGELDFDTFRLNLEGEIDRVQISAEYRLYRFMDVVHHAWVGYDFTDTWQGRFGVTQVPFGLLPCVSHNFWIGIPYYLGLADDYDLGLKFLKKSGHWDFQFAFFKNAEWGAGNNAQTYSYNVVKGGLGQQNEETNQLNARLAYTFTHGETGSTEVGMSGQWSQLYNDATDKNGDHWAAAAHLHGVYGRWDLMLEAALYEYNPENPDGVSDKSIEVGGFNDSFLIAAKGTVLAAGLSYNVPVKWGPVTGLTFYNDYSVLIKDESDWTDSQINTLGCLVSAGPIMTFVDFVMGKNALYVGGPRDAFAAGDATGPFGEDHDWHTRVNINFGYYF